MSNKGAFTQKCGVLNIGLTLSICLYALMGFFGYLKYGEKTAVTITLNLPLDNWVFMGVKMLFTLSIFMSFGVQFYVIIDIIWPDIEDKMAARGHPIGSYWEYLFRFLLVCAICGFCAVIPHLDLLMSLVGGVGCAALMMIFPCIIDMLVFPTTRYLWTKDITILVIGFVGIVSCTYSSLAALIHTYKHPV